MNDIEQAIKLIQQRQADVIAIYVFGSSGSSYETSESDLDLAMLPLRPLARVY